LLEAEEVKEVFKAMAMKAMAMEEVEVLASIILTSPNKQLQSKDSRYHKQRREPRGTLQSSIMLTS
jgi:hypothetical protein